MKDTNSYILGNRVTSCSRVIVFQDYFQTNQITGSGEFTQIFQENLLAVSNKDHNIRLQFSTMSA